MIGIGIITHDFPEQVLWWDAFLACARHEHEFEACISFDGRALDGLCTPVLSGPGLGVAHTKNGALRYLHSQEADVLVLIEDDCRVLGWEFFEQLQRVAKYIPHLMLGPVREWPHTWELTGPTREINGELLLQYRRKREPQDTPGVVSMITRAALECCGGLDGRFIGRGHAHGEWTERVHRAIGSPLGSPYWILDTPHLEYVQSERPRQKRPNEAVEIASNAALRQGLAIGATPTPIPNVDYLLHQEARPQYPISVCMCLMNRVDTLRPCLDSLAEWFAEDERNEVVIADFGSTDCDLEAELTDRNLPHRIVRLDGHFARGRGLHRAAQAASNPLLMFLDADMLVPRRFGDYIRTFARPGECLFPICWSLHEGTGWWRTTGYGMLAIHRDDYSRVGGWNLTRHVWGGEDDDMHWHCHHRGLIVHRCPISGYVHQWHPCPPRPSGRWRSPDVDGRVQPPLNPNWEEVI